MSSTTTRTGPTVRSVNAHRTMRKSSTVDHRPGPIAPAASTPSSTPRPTGFCHHTPGSCPRRLGRHILARVGLCLESHLRLRRPGLRLQALLLLRLSSGALGQPALPPVLGLSWRFRCISNSVPIESEAGVLRFQGAPDGIVKRLPSHLDVRRSPKPIEDALPHSPPSALDNVHDEKMLVALPVPREPDERAVHLLPLAGASAPRRFGRAAARFRETGRGFSASGTSLGHATSGARNRRRGLAAAMHEGKANLIA